MTQERKELPRASEDRNLRSLQFLQEQLFLPQEGGVNERSRIAGLSLFFHQMADPSPEFLEAAISNLASVTIDNLWQLRSAAFQAGQDPEAFIGEHKTPAARHMLFAGLDNCEMVLHDILYLRENDGDLDPKDLAESAYELIQVRNGEKQLERMADQIHNEPDLKKRYHLSLNLRKVVLSYVEKFSFRFYRRQARDETIEPTWENLTLHSDLIADFNTKGGGSMSGSSNFGVQDATEMAQATIARYELEKGLKGLPSKDQAKFEQLRYQYGAKAANLIILSELVGSINRLRKGRLFDASLAVPDFKVIPVDLYRAWREEKLLDGDLHPYFEWANALKKERTWSNEGETKADYMVRSSAVFSEDGENVTGAGIYQSIKVIGGSAFEDFRDAVHTVYRSTDSLQALNYRIQHGIDNEEMGVVIQKFVTPDTSFRLRDSEKGYINSRLAGVPQLMEVVTETSRNFINRQELDFFLAAANSRDKRAVQNLFHFLPDQYKVRPGLPISVAKITSAVERIWGKDIQVEFVANGLTINFVQVRELPKGTFNQIPEVQFPNETPVHSGAAIGVGDMELPVLDEQDDNREKTGVTIIPSNEMFSMGDNSYRLPKEGAVIISNDNGRNGHIQTLCAEKGLVCIFPELNEKEDQPILRHNEFLKLKKIRIVANGLEGRVYLVQQ